MKNKLILLIAFIGLNSIIIAQDSIRVTPQGITVGVIKTNNNNFTNYNKALKWVNNTYKYPEKVIGKNIQGEGLTINGYVDNAWGQRQFGLIHTFSLSYVIKIDIKDSLITFQFIEQTHYISNGQKYLGSSRNFFKRNGDYYDKMYNIAKPSLEATINNLWVSFYKVLIDNTKTYDEAISELKRAKEKLDLELITQDEYEKIKEDLSKYLK